MYKVYFNDEVSESVELASFEKLAEAKDYINDYLKGKILVDDDHDCTDDVFCTSAVANLEIYEGDSVKLDEDGEPYPDMPIYESDYFYTR